MKRGDLTKHDGGKLMWDLLPWAEVEEMVEILTLAVEGKEGYEAESWKQTPDARKRYFAALQRHLIAWFKGEDIAPQFNKRHLAHAGCCLLFLMWHMREPDNKKTEGES